MEVSEYVFLNRISSVDSVDGLVLTFESLWEKVVLIEFEITQARIRYRRRYRDEKVDNVVIDFGRVENVFLKRNVVFVESVESFLENPEKSNSNPSFALFPVIINRSLKSIICVPLTFKNEVFLLAGNIINILLQKISLEMTVEKSQRYFNEILTNINSRIVVADKNHNIVFSNRDIKGAYKCYEHVFDKDAPCQFCVKDNRTITIKDGDEHYEVQQIKLDRNIVCISKNITSFVKLKEELGKSQKLSLLGKLSGEIAHEIKNPLNTINLKLQVLKRKMGELEEIKEIHREIKRLSRITTDFLSLGKELSLEVKEENLREILDEVKKRYTSLCKISTSYCSDVKLRVDKDKFLQVLINLINNSIEASATEIEIICEKSSDSVCIKIRDNGRGIKNPSNLFTPFYSEKPSGTGLGLVVAKRIVEAHSGNISFSGIEDEKTTFTINLPL